MNDIRLLLLAAAAASAAVPFAPVDTSMNAMTLKFPTGMRADIVLRTGDSIDGLDNIPTVARRTFDYVGFHGLGPTKGNDSAILGVNSELRDSSTTHGDGGGFTLFKVVRNPQDNSWSRVGRGRAVDFRAVGGTWVNCGGFDTPWGTMVSGEEYPALSNAEAYAGGSQIRDTSDVVVKTQGFDDTLRRYEAHGWMVEIDPLTAIARKLYKMGRFSHEGGVMLPDRRTVILTDDMTPAVLFKYVATRADDLIDGQLYAYKQNADGMGGSWITLPMQLDSLVNIREVALRRGATAGIRHEWVVYHEGKVFVAETGIDGDKGAIAKAVATGATVEKHLKGTIYKNDTALDYHGRILVLDTATWNMSVFIEGGVMASGKHMSSVDGMHVHKIGNKAYLVLLEDLVGRTQGRDPSGKNICEGWWLDLAIANPTVDSLQRMLVGANGAELTGSTQTPDGKTMFVVVQHPSSSNTAPYDKDVVVALTGFDLSVGISKKEMNRKVRPFRQLDGQLRFQAATSGTIRDLEGRTLTTFEESESVKVPQGASVLETSRGSWKILKP